MPFGSALCVIAVCVLAHSAHSCPGGVGPCRGNRPRGPDDCCPSGPGQRCGNGGEGAGRCDTELGYTCVEPSPGNGTCRGPFGLTVTDIDYTSLTLTWNAVAPPGYSLEYSRLMSTDLAENISTWVVSEVGNKSHAAVEGLSPGSLYFFRIGVWEVPYNGVYRNLSEVVIVNTLAGCKLSGRWVDVGYRSEVDCETWCVCSAGQEWECGEVCEGVVDMEPGPGVTCSYQPAGEEYPECCQQLVCVTSDGHCMDEDGVRHEDNSSYSRPCEQCRCRAGEISCLEVVECESPQEEGCERVAPSEGDCCPRYLCPKDCQEGNTTYLHGQKVTRGCNDYCVCRDGTVVCGPICEPVDLTPTAECPFPGLIVPRRSSCPVRNCPQSCLIEGTPKAVGLWHPDSHCRECRCQGDNKVTCSPSCNDDITGVSSSLGCPSPQVVTDESKCCPQVVCAPGNEPNTFENIGVDWRGNGVILLQFKFPDEDKLDGPLKGFDVFYTNTADDSWQNVFVRRENLTNASHVDFRKELLTKPLLSNQTVFIPLLSMDTNLHHLVQVELIIEWEEILTTTLEYTGSSNLTTIPGLLPEPDPPRAPVSPTVAVAALVTYKCVVAGQHIRHGEQYQSGCDTICSCNYGELTCLPVCPESNEVCPKVAEEIRSDSCCGRTKCYGKPGCCHYGNTTIADGETVRERCERFCRCDNGTLQCWPVCPNEKPENPECRRVYYKDRCCPTWRCPAEEKPPYAIEVTLVLRLAGVCQEVKGDSSSFLHDLVSILIANFKSEKACPDSKSGGAIVACHHSQIRAFCPVYIAYLRQKREAGMAAITIVMKVTALTQGVNGSATFEARLSTAIGKIEAASSALSPIHVGNVSYPIVSGAVVRDRTIICGHGYIRQGDGCMAGHVISSNRSVSYHVEMTTVDVTTNTATLRWRGLPHVELDYLEELMLEYRDISTNGSWIATSKLHSSTTLYVLHSLTPATHYLVRLILLTSSLGVNKYTAAHSSFQTHHSTVPIPTVVRPEIVEMTVEMTSVTVRWSDPQPGAEKFTSHVFIAFKEIQNDHITSFQRSVFLIPTVTQFTLTGLQPDTMYKLKVGLVLSNGTTVYSLIADLRTKQALEKEDGSDLASHRGVIYGVSAVAILAVGALIILFVCIFRKGRGSSRLSSCSSETNFENKMFDMDAPPAQICKE